MRLIPQLLGAAAFVLLGYWLGTRHASATRETQTVTVQSASPTPKPGTKGTNGQTAGYHLGMAAEFLRSLSDAGDSTAHNRMMILQVAGMTNDERRLVVEELLAMPEGTEHRFQLLNEALDQWASVDAPGALTWVQGLSPTLPGVISLGEHMTELIACNLATVDGAKAAQLLHTLKDGERSLGTVYQAWALQDPEAAMAAAAALKDWEQHMAIKGMAMGMMKLDPTKAMTICEKLPVEKRAEAQELILREWIGKDLQAAGAWLLSISDENQKKLFQIGSSIGTLLTEKAKQDPAAALKFAEQFPEPIRRSAMADATSGWASKDFNAAWDWAKTLASPEERNSILIRLGIAGASESPETILRLAEEFTSEEATEEFFDRCCERLSYSEPLKLADLLRKMSPAQLGMIKNADSLLRALSSDHPKALVQLLSDAPSLRTEFALRDALNSWSLSNPQEAFEWATTHPEGANYINTTLQSMARQSPQDALAKAELLPDTPQRAKIMVDLFDVWRDNDLAGLEKALPSLNGTSRKFAQEQIFFAEQNRDLAAAAMYLQNLQSSNRPEDVQAGNNPAMLQYLGSRWGGKEPDAAINWIPKVPAGELREEFIQYLAMSWTSQDTTKASQWVAGLPAGTEKDAAVIGMLGTIGGSDPEAAFAWLAQIGNADKKEAGYAEIIQSLHNKSPEAAKSALETAPISEKRKAELREDWK